MSGQLLPYLLRADWMITTTLFLCLIWVSYVLSHGRKRLLQQLNSFISHRDRGSLFDEVTSTEVSHTFILMLHSCIVIGMLIYHYYSCVQPELFQLYSHALLLGGYVAGVFILFLLKCLAYAFVNWIFFDKYQNSIWISSYYNVIVWQGLLLLPVLLLVVYFDLPLTIELISVCFIFLLIKISLFFKCFSNFFGNFCGVFHLILYLCGLEILPDLILWKIIESINDLLLQY